MEFVTAAEFDQRIQETWRSSEASNCTCNGFDAVWQGRHYFSDDSTRIVELRSDLLLEIVDDTYHHSVAIKGSHDDSQDLVSKFYLSGYHRVCTDENLSCDREYVETAQQSYLFYLPSIEETEQYFAGDRVHLVRIYWGLEFLQTISRGHDSIPPPLKTILEGDRLAPRFHIHAGNFTAEINTAVQQLVQTPYQGVMQRLYLESKVLELLALQLTQIQAANTLYSSSVSIKPTEIERVYHAKEILLSNLLHPPTVLDLAQQVGLHHMKLKKGFRQVFGTTPFGYLREHRLEQAWELLQDENLSVETAAHRVGYSHLGHFSNAFKRKFGITPGRCRS
jgi:AraC-like DNA-binding protein